MTLKEGLEIQAKQLAEWETKLKPEVFEIVKKHCEEKNRQLHHNKSGFNVFRGEDINVFIRNLKIKTPYKPQVGEVVLVTNQNGAQYLVKVEKCYENSIFGSYSYFSKEKGLMRIDGQASFSAYDNHFEPADPTHKEETKCLTGF